MKNSLLIFTLLLLEYISSSPNGTKSMLLVGPSKESGKEIIPDDSFLNPSIYEMNIKSNISNRFARTLVVSRVKNTDSSAREATFMVILPEKAFISEFVMETGGKSYKAYVKEKEEAEYIYNQALSSGQSAGHVAVSARDSNKFTVSVNIEPKSEASFLLTYEELLERKNSQYELIINIHPGQIVKKFDIEVDINESRPLKFVKTPSLRSGNEISKNKEQLDPSSNIKMTNSTNAIVKFSPDSRKQKEFAHSLGTKEADGLSGQFVVQYDVERDPHGGEILLQDGYFVHFFAPTELKPLPKHVLFLLDTSGSMWGRKLEQLKKAMNSILDEMKINDKLSLIEFNDYAIVWDIHLQKSIIVSDYLNKLNTTTLNTMELPSPVKANGDNIVKAKNIIETKFSTGGTNAIAGLKTTLYLANRELDKSSNKNDTLQPIIIFLTDGQPNTGESSTERITEIVTELNLKNKVPIFSLSFGEEADKEFLRKLSLNNLGFSRHIYEASDASLQLQEFYKQISSPLLSNISFKYEDKVQEITKSHFPIYFDGSELIVAGKYEDDSFAAPAQCWAYDGPLNLTATTEKPVTSLERLWAFLTIKQTLEARDSIKDKTELTKKALDLALKYSFVTDVTSLVVVKPNETSREEDYNLSTADGTDFGSTSTGAGFYPASGAPGMASYQAPYGAAPPPPVSGVALLQPGAAPPGAALQQSGGAPGMASYQTPYGQISGSVYPSSGYLGPQGQSTGSRYPNSGSFGQAGSSTGSVYPSPGSFGSQGTGLGPMYSSPSGSFGVQQPSISSVYPSPGSFVPQGPRPSYVYPSPVPSSLQRPTTGSGYIFPGSSSQQGQNTGSVYPTPGYFGPQGPRPNIVYPSPGFLGQSQGPYQGPYPAPGYLGPQGPATSSVYPSPGFLGQSGQINGGVVYPSQGYYGQPRQINGVSAVSPSLGYYGQIGQSNIATPGYYAQPGQINGAIYSPGYYGQPRLNNGAIYPSPGYLGQSGPSNGYLYPSPAYPGQQGLGTGSGYSPPGFVRPQQPSSVYPSQNHLGRQTQGINPVYPSPGYLGPQGPTIGSAYQPSGYFNQSITQTATRTSKLENLLPWLRSTLNPDRTITVFSGTWELGENVEITSNIQCSRTPFNTTDTGLCTLLKDCQEVYSFLTDLQVYQKYFCAINNKFAGVCCPKKLNNQQLFHTYN